MRKGQFYDLETYVPEVKVKQEEFNDEEWASNQNKPSFPLFTLPLFFTLFTSYLFYLTFFW